MFDDILKAKVNREVGRINGELCDLKSWKRARGYGALASKSRCDRR